MRTSVGRKGDGQASCDAEWCGGHREVELSNKGVSVFFGWRICLVKRRRSPSFFKKVFSYLIIGCAGSSLRLSGFLCGRQRLLFTAVHRLLNAVVSPVAEHGL